MGTEEGNEVEIFTTDFGLMALLGGVLSSLMTSLSGTIVILRRMAFFGSGIAHLSFAGVGLALILNLPITPVVLGIAVLSALVLGHMARRGIHEDTGVAILFSSSMALGVILIYLSGVDSSRIMAYLFVDILAITRTDIVSLLILTTLVVLYMSLFRDHLVYMTFDEDFSKILGIKIGLVYYSFLVILAISIVFSIKIMGIILVSAMLVIPSASAFQVSKTYQGAYKLSPLLASISVFLGLILSYSLDLPAGASIVIIQGIIFLLMFTVRILSE